jgi:hypothetical protein
MPTDDRSTSHALQVRHYVRGVAEIVVALPLAMAEE